ncbi:MAG: gliding motility lipoprotein GldK [Flavobacteriaceae bacterium]|nr:gliding motility lipoprotein GldK [Flavobacteriaceae bacterium]
MRQTAILILLISLAYGCGSGGNSKGDLVGVETKSKWNSETPTGMVLVPGGTFTMGKQDEDPIGALNTPARTSTVRPFYMDETEITNSEYKQFVFWVRDSIVRTKLALMAELNGDPATGPLADYQFQDTTDNGNMYVKYMMTNYGSLGDVNSPTLGRFLNWEKELVYDINDLPSVEYVEVLDSMWLPLEESFDGRRMMDVRKFKYEYSWLDQEAAARQGTTRKDQIIREVREVYPDTTVWVKDFAYSYNDPMHQDYFWHQAYGDYPVVGITWHQAKAFASWRTKVKNDYLSSRKNGVRVPHFRLPSEAEWEYAARGGLEYGKYPWGGPYTTSDRGCFLANFKPARGDYAVDGALYTMEAKSYNKNGYGLYNMAGNVSEWTGTAYNEASYYFGSTMNPNVEDRQNHRKVIRGGSWKDVAYFLEVSSRAYEYADTARSYIGFRTVQDYLGTDLRGKK